MKLWIFVLFLFACDGCKNSPKANTAHIVAVDTCEGISAIFGGKEYLLSPAGAPAGVACYSPVRIEDVGKDMPAELDTERGLLTLTTPEMGRVAYSISFAKEAK